MTSPKMRHDLRKTAYPQAINDKEHPQLRQAAVSAIVKAHSVIEDDTKLFDKLGGLTKSQIHLCTYLFARENSQSRSAFQLTI